jgi:hypothetical protein
MKEHVRTRKHKTKGHRGFLLTNRDIIHGCLLYLEKKKKLGYGMKDRIL